MQHDVSAQERAGRERGGWLDLARKLDWAFSYVAEEDVFPAVQSGTPWLPHREWAAWDEPYRTTYAEYVSMQSAKDAAVHAVMDAVGKPEDYKKLPAPCILEDPGRRAELDSPSRRRFFPPGVVASSAHAFGHAPSEAPRHAGDEGVAT